MRACANCGVSLAEDQRYCLECGTRQVQARSQFLERFTPAAVGPHPSASVPPSPGVRSTNTTALAGIGVLLLAMGVGVLIGRASGSSASTSPQVISVNSPAAASNVAPTGATEPSGAGAASELNIPEDWPTGKSGYTVQLQTFSASTARASEVTAAKRSAQGKVATGVGILLSSNFASLPADQYVIYSGDYSSEAQAKQALSKVKSRFPAAAVVHVSGASGGGSANPSPSPSSSSNGSAAKTGSSGAVKGSGNSSGSSGSGQDAEKKSLSLPNVVTTG